MQDEVRDKSVAFVISVGKTGGRLTADLLKAAMRRYLEHSRDADALNAAFAEYTAKTMGRSTPKKPSLLARLSHFKEVAKQMAQDRAKNREKGEMER